MKVGPRHFTYRGGHRSHHWNNSQKKYIKIRQIQAMQVILRVALIGSKGEHSIRSSGGDIRLMIDIQVEKLEPTSDGCAMRWLTK